MNIEDFSTTMNPVTELSQNISSVFDPLCKFSTSLISFFKPLLFKFAFPLGYVQCDSSDFIRSMIVFAIVSTVVIGLVIVATINLSFFSKREDRRELLIKISMIPVLAHILQYFFYFYLPLEGSTFFQSPLNKSISMYGIFLIQSLILLIFCCYSMYTISPSGNSIIPNLLAFYIECTVFGVICKNFNLKDSFRYFHMLMLFQSIAFILVYSFKLIRHSSYSTKNTEIAQGNAFSKNDTFFYNKKSKGNNNLPNQKNNIYPSKEFKFMQNKQEPSGIKFSLFSDLTYLNSSDSQKDNFSLPNKTKNEFVLSTKKRSNGTRKLYNKKDRVNSGNKYESSYGNSAYPYINFNYSNIVPKQENSRNANLLSYEKNVPYPTKDFVFKDSLLRPYYQGLGLFTDLNSPYTLFDRVESDIGRSIADLSSILSMPYSEITRKKVSNENTIQFNIEFNTYDFI